MDIFNYDNRGLRILNMLERTSSVSDKQLIDDLKVSLKTIQNEIKYLNELFNNVSYIKHLNNEYTLYIVQFEKYLNIKNKIYDMYKNFDSSKVRMVYIFKKLIESKHTYLIDDLSDEMIVSRSTLNSDLKKLKTIIQDYNLKIVGKANNGIKLVGLEKDIRLFVINNVYNYIYKEDIFDNEDIYKFLSLFKKYKIDLQIKSEFLKYLTLTLDRTGNDFILNFENNQFEELLTFYAYDFVDEVCKYINERYSINLTEDDKKFLVICFVTMRVPSNIEKISTNFKYSKKYKELVSKILFKIYSEYGVKLDISTIIQEFIYHIYFLMQRQKYGIVYKNNLTETIKEKYFMSYKMAKTAGEVIFDNYKYKISEDEICYMAIYFETFLSKINLGIKNLKILLVTDTGPAYRKLMVEQIKSTSKDISSIELTTSINEINIEKFDVVITTLKEEIKSSNLVIYQNEILDLDYIKKEISYYKYIGKVNTANIKGMESILISSIKENTVFLLDSKLTYKENLYNMIDVLKDEKLIDSDFLNRIRKREKVSSMIFSKNIAFPHTKNKLETTHLIMALGISEEGFLDNKDLKLIFLACIPENTSNSMLLVRTYDELISIIKEDGLVDELVKLKNYQEVVNYFIKNTDLYR